ncbi:MAG: ABC transporter substrate-binding protein [Candidatus Hodarchaeales archaeon]|jgi:ABC-type branched-subunit amino acid transport system substrate-binding protein
MKIKKPLLVIAVIFCMVLSLSPGLIVAEVQADDILIGSLAPMAITPGIDCNYAIELAIKEINDAGGVTCGGTAHDLKLYQESTSGTTGFPDSSTASASYTKLRDEKAVVAMIGGFRTEVMQALQLGGHVDIPFLGVGATVPLISPYFWRVMPGNGTNLFYAMAGFYAWQLGPHYGVENITIFREDNQWSVKMARSLHAALPLYGLAGYAGYTQKFCGDAETADPALYVENDIVVSTEATYDAVKAALNAGYNKHKPNALLTIFSGPVGKYATQAWAALGLGDKGVIMAGSNVESQIETIWDATEGAPYGEIVMQTPNDIEMTNTTEAFRAAYKAYSGKSPSYTAWGGYDAVYIIKEALERAYASTAYDPLTASEDIQAELINTDWYGPRARIRFTNERGPHVGVDEYGYYIVIPGAGALYDNASVHDTYSPNSLLPPTSLGETTATGGVYNVSGDPVWAEPGVYWKQWQAGGKQVSIDGPSAFPDVLAYDNTKYFATADPTVCQNMAMGEPYETYGLWPWLVPFVGDSPSANPKLPADGSYTNWSPTRCFTKWAQYKATWAAITGNPSFDIAHDTFFDNASEYYEYYGHYPANMSNALNWTDFSQADHGWVAEPEPTSETEETTTSAEATETSETEESTAEVPGFVLPLVFLVLTCCVLLFRRKERNKYYKR